MQLRLTFDEIGVLYDILGETDRELRERLSHTQDQELKRELTLQQAPVQALLDRVVARTLEFTADELETLGGVLAKRYRELLNAISDEQERQVKSRLERKRGLLRSLQDKVAEACAMV
jgi:hypothetical protein